MRQQPSWSREEPLLQYQCWLLRPRMQQHESTPASNIGNRESGEQKRAGRRGGGGGGEEEGRGGGGHGRAFEQRTTNQRCHSFGEKSGKFFAWFDIKLDRIWQHWNEQRAWNAVAAVTGIGRCPIIGDSRSAEGDCCCSRRSMKISIFFDTRFASSNVQLSLKEYFLSWRKHGWKFLWAHYDLISKKSGEKSVPKKLITINHRFRL